MFLVFSDPIYFNIGNTFATNTTDNASLVKTIESLKQEISDLQKWNGKDFALIITNSVLALFVLLSFYATITYQKKEHLRKKQLFEPLIEISQTDDEEILGSYEISNGRVLGLMYVTLNHKWKIENKGTIFLKFVDFLIHFENIEQKIDLGALKSGETKELELNEQIIDELRKQFQVYKNFSQKFFENYLIDKELKMSFKYRTQMNDLKQALLKYKFCEKDEKIFFKRIDETEL